MFILIYKTVLAYITDIINYCKIYDIELLTLLLQRVKHPQYNGVIIFMKLITKMARLFNDWKLLTYLLLPVTPNGA